MAAEMPVALLFAMLPPARRATSRLDEGPELMSTCLHEPMCEAHTDSQDVHIATMRGQGSAWSVGKRTVHLEKSLPSTTLASTTMSSTCPM